MSGHMGICRVEALQELGLLSGWIVVFLGLHSGEPKFLETTMLAMLDRVAPHVVQVIMFQILRAATWLCHSSGNHTQHRRQQSLNNCTVLSLASFSYSQCSYEYPC